MILLVACSTREERHIKSLRSLTMELEQKSDEYTDADWQRALQDYETITESLENGRYTDAERREIGKLKGQCWAAFTTYAIDACQRELQGATQELEGALEGFMGAFDTIQ